MRAEPLQALQAALPRKALPVAAPGVLMAGAAGVLGNEMLRRLAGCGRYGLVRMLTRKPITEALGGIEWLVVPPEVAADWPVRPSQIGVILFDPPRLFYDRERALWTPRPDQLRGMLSVLRYMVPSSEQPVRAAKVAELVDLALRSTPPGIHVAAPEMVWQAAQGDLQVAVNAWFGA